MKNWEVVRLLGQGSMGEVYQVKNSLGQQGAMKIVNESCLSDEESKFLQDEAKVLLKLRHRNIVRVYEAGFDKLQYFFVQELVLGRNANASLKKYGVFKLEEALRICRDIGSALDYLWRERKIIHRDIKPENIMLSREGVVKLMDLGVGMTVDEVKKHNFGAGTPYYMSPEMIQKPATCDFRTDIYSLGISLIEMVSGEKPYKGRTQKEVFEDILSNDVNLNKLELSEKSRLLLGRLIDRDVNRRPGSWAEAVHILAEINENESKHYGKNNQVLVYDLSSNRKFMFQYMSILVGIFLSLWVLIYVVL